MSEVASNTCTWYNCTRIIDRDKYCFHHKQYSGTPAPKKEVKAIPKVSEKRKVIDKEYKKIKTEMLKKDDRCKIKSPVCTGKAESLNHTQKRSPKNLIELGNLKGCCISCNGYLESHDDWARQNGHTISRFKKGVPN